MTGTDAGGGPGPLADDEWRLIREEARDGPTNMALDEVAARTAADGGPRTLRVYRWEPSTLSLGYHQDPETVDWAFCEREGITVTRRPTGGGGIYHDAHADISYTITAPAADLPGDLMESYHLLCDPLFDGFARMGVDARFADEGYPELYHPACYLRELHPAHDVVVDAEAGGESPTTAAGRRSAADGAGGESAPVRKLSGNAQYRRRDAVIQHGSISYDLRPDRHLGVFADPPLDADGFRDRVTSVREEAGIDREDAVRALEDALRDWADAEEGGWTDAELSAARELADAKYATDDWTRDRADPTA